MPGVKCQVRALQSVGAAVAGAADGMRDGAVVGFGIGSPLGLMGPSFELGLTVGPGMIRGSGTGLFVGLGVGCFFVYVCVNIIQGVMC